ncbi:hypothetical protein M413DRAFT_156388 [Hebeloma cylindrosporum]|uniref:Uncharacterized protein n=1 Tax=Hebeloma cylindrosporum TaxID=76867 RepID=A0A0C2XTC1_HEBCY|nr:hypothetical protein M413DRAFT_156388 [Hebeloma cylindrosporum h7]
MAENVSQTVQDIPSMVLKCFRPSPDRSILQRTVNTSPNLATSSLGATHNEYRLDIASQQLRAPPEAIVSSTSNIPSRYSICLECTLVLLILHSVSFFPHSNNFTVRCGNFYGAGRDVVITQVDSNQSPKGIVEGLDVFTAGDVPPSEEIYKGRGYRIYSAHSTTKARAVKIKLYEGSRAKERCLAAADFGQRYSLVWTTFVSCDILSHLWD